ncbi:hypothetical protein ACFQFC_15835 [Amorphoplanes digitatis]|uniref:Uncharacterized protein n=1 Tax=Actinoplanes digitatis TaxID=1868 RepID=A0A7W7I3C2_9ACTN|nr:hypothetical protein [Actinoplanes digitatis]MBB4765684.1 hypothetical protein [Actinoplanes digitatis]GID98020.1 hypothetical protein Adi01nite_74320 [Actinoplanes digitatis]
MITTGQEPSRWTRLTSGYVRWEHRKAARFNSWSSGRRWATFVLLPTLVFCCGGTVVGVPVVWAIRETVEASRGAPSPDAAANEYLMALGYDTEDGLLPVLDDDHQDELVAEWRAYRKAMDSTNPPPARLDFGALAVGPLDDGQAAVTADVSATWWDTGGPATSYRSKAFTWRFRAREDDGWQVVSVEAPAWCGGYVRQDACQ